MKRVRVFGLLWMVLLALLLVASAACGGDDDADSGDAAAAPTAVPEASSGDAMGDAMGEPVVTRVIITNPSPGRESNNVQKDLAPPPGMQLKPTYESLVGYDPDTAELTPQLGQVLGV